jgi:RNA polymerase sigma-70 factor (ECF subfamily)
MNMATTWAEAEFETIFREHFARTVGVIRRVLRSDAEAEEICAEAFLKLYRMGPGGVAEDRAGAWLYRVATRSAIDRLRRHKRRGFEEPLDAGRADIAVDLQSDPLFRLVREEQIGEVRLALARLKAEKAQVLLLRHSGLSYQEIAAAMRIKLASVGTMLARAEAEFSKLYQRMQRLSKHGPRLQAANHPSDEDLSLGTPAKEGQ